MNPRLLRDATGIVRRLSVMAQHDLMRGARVADVRHVVEEIAECHRVLVQLPGVTPCPN